MAVERKPVRMRFPGQSTGASAAAKAKDEATGKTGDVAAGDAGPPMASAPSVKGAGGAPPAPPVAAPAEKVAPGRYGTEGDDWVYEVQVGGDITVRNTATGKTVALKAGSPEYTAVETAILGTNKESDRLTLGGGAAGKPVATAPGASSPAPVEEGLRPGESEQPDLGTSDNPFEPARMRAAVREAVAEKESREGESSLDLSPKGLHARLFGADEGAAPSGPPAELPGESENSYTGTSQVPAELPGESENPDMGTSQVPAELPRESENPDMGTSPNEGRQRKAPPKDDWQGPPLPPLPPSPAARLTEAIIATVREEAARMAARKAVGEQKEKIKATQRAVRQ